MAHGLFLFADLAKPHVLVVVLMIVVVMDFFHGGGAP